MIKVLYCHGMGGDGLSNHRKVVALFKQYGIDIISPTINHSFFINNPFIFDAMKEVAKDVDIIVGNSMGGYFAYHLGKACGKPTLCFNPAISEITTSYSWFNRVTNYEASDEQKKTLILMGTEDDVVDHGYGKRFVERNGFETDEIQDMVGETHGLAFFSEDEDAQFKGIFPTIVDFAYENYNTESQTEEITL